jgi:hypothetical protein
MFINHYYNCPSCQTKNNVSIDAEDRGQLQIKKGDEIGFTCKSCHKKEKIHINKIYAEASKIIYIIAIIVSVLIIAFLWDLGIVIVSTFGLPMGVYLYQQSLARNFNNYKIRK